MPGPFWLTLISAFLGCTLIPGLLSFYIYISLKIKIAGIIRNNQLAGVFNLYRKLTGREFLESNLRAATGAVIERPFGTTRHYFDWGQIQFNPVFLSRQPLNAEVAVDTTVVLGPKARKPVTLKIPALIGAMSYGNALSQNAKIALAKAASLSGTATCSGNGPFLPEERQAAWRYIFQYSRGFWSKTEDVFRQADLIEIGLGHGAWVSAPVRIKGQKINETFAKNLQSIPGLDVVIEASLPEVDDLTGLKKLISDLKEVSGGVPVGVKFGFTHYLEEEMRMMVEAGVDIIVCDGLEGGTHGCPPFLLDDIGLPSFPGICRAVRFFEKNQLRDKISLVVGGGLNKPGDFAKPLALGADAVLIGTVASLAMSHTQVTKTLRLWEPPTGLIFFDGNEASQFDPELGAKNLHYFLESCIREISLLTRNLGKTSTKEFDKNDLVALNQLYANIAGIAMINHS